MSDYRWSLGTLIGLPIAALVTLALVLFAGFLLWIAFSDRDGEVLTFGILVTLAAAAVVAAIAWGMWPYKAEYHQWQTTSGTVQAIDSRLLSTGDGGPTERFVVTFDDGRQRSCDDTRCAQVEEGDELTLACKRAWQWSGTHGYDCSYISHEAVR